MTWYFRTIEPRQGRVFPVPDADSGCSDCLEHNGIGKLRFALAEHLATAKTAHEKTMLQRQITATDRQIDQLVYALYGLTTDEIKIVEEVER